MTEFRRVLFRSSFIKLEAALFREMIDKTIYSVSNDETRYHLNGVYFEKVDKDFITMVATDGHRLSLIKKQFKNLSLNEKIGVIIPKKGLFEIKKLIESTVDEVFVAVEGSQFILKAGTCVLMIRLIEGKYPNYQQFIPQKFLYNIVVPREAILSSLKRVSLLANQKSKAIMMCFSENKLEITSNNPELGDAKEELDISYSGPELKIGFNAKYIEDVLKNIDQENIELVPIKASAGYLDGYADPTFMSDLPKFYLPMFRQGTYRGFEIKGDSMPPLQSGTIIIGEYLENWSNLKLGETCIIISKNDGIAYKRIGSKFKENKPLKLLSDNPIYEPYTVACDEIIEIWKAKAYISTQFPEPAPEPTLETITAMVSQMQKSITDLQKNKS